MTITGLLIIIPGICYGLAAGIYMLKSNWPLGIVYFGYSVANIGLLWLDKLTSK